MAIDKNNTERETLRLYLWLALFAGIVIMLIGVVWQLEIEKSQVSNQLAIVVSNFLVALGHALIAGGIIGQVIEIPSILGQIDRSVKKLVMSKDYVKSLPQEELLGLRELATKSIYEKVDSTVDESFLQLDKSLCTILTEPFLEFQAVQHKCKIVNQGGIKYVEKSIITHIKFKNPNNNPYDVSSILFAKSYFDPIENMAHNEIRTLQQLLVRRDAEKEYKSIGDKLDVVIEDNLIESSKTYKLISYLNWKSGSESKGLTFQDEMDIEIRETRKVPIHDTVFILKVFRPVKNFSLHYAFEDAKPKISGTIFGTLSNKNDGTIQVNQDSNSITLRSSRWLLQGNGVFVSVCLCDE